MHRLPALLCASIALAAAPAGSEPREAADACAARAVAAVQKRYESVSALRARFEQTTRSVAFGAAGPVTSSRGEVVFAKPGKMRWHYREPEESVVVSDGSWLWIYDPAAREAQKLPVGEGTLSGAGVQFLLGEGHIERDFRIDAETCDEREARLLLTPREPASFETLRLRVDAARGDLRETEIVDLLGNVTRIAFLDLEHDPPVAPELFRFVPPEGVRVVELEPPAAR